MVPAELRYPGVYVQEAPSGERTVAGASTSTAAFVDLFADGPITSRDEAYPVEVASFNEFDRTFGGLDARSEASYAVRQFFDNGGRSAWVVRADDGTGAVPDGERLIAAMRSGLDAISPFVFNIFCLPIAATYSPSEAGVVIGAALEYCRGKRAFMIVDIPESVQSVGDMLAWIGSYGGPTRSNGAVYFPRLVIADPLAPGRSRNIGPSGTMAGIYARTDASRGVWKAPAGSEAVLRGVDLAFKMNDAQNGQLNPLGVNCLRSFPVHGNVAWGARTLAGADLLGSEWKYVNVRRLADYIEASLELALGWTVFEPNDESLWSQIRLEVSGFLQGLFVNGAFAGSSPDRAYFVRCDSTTTTTRDVAGGSVNVLVGIAPTRPAEFIILRIELRAGQG